MTINDLEKGIKGTIHRLPDDFLSTRRVDNIYGQPVLSIHIGDTDFTICEDGSCPGGGTTLNGNWDIQPSIKEDIDGKEI